MQYAPRVKELLAGICEIHTPEINCSYTMFTVWYIKKWLLLDHIDLIHWNNGIWDHHRTLNDGIPMSIPEQYLYLNRRLHNLLKEYTNNLIWATTTPPNGKHDPNGLLPPMEIYEQEVILYNTILTAYLSSQGVEINDLHALIGQNPAAYVCDDGIHLSEAGIEIAAAQVAAKIRAKLGV